MKTIRTKIMASILVPVAIVAAVIGGISAYMNFQSTFSTLTQTLSQSVTIAANQVAAGLSNYKTLALETAQNIILNGANSKERKLEELERIASTHHLIAVELLDENGISLGSGSNLGGSDYFTAVKSGKDTFVTDPVLRDDKMVIYIAAPILESGNFKGAAVIVADADFLSEIVANIKVGTGNAAVLNKDGDTIGFADTQLVRDKYNTQKEVASDSRLKRLAEIEASMCRGEKGIGEYYYGGKEKLMAYQPVPGTDGWSIDIAIVRNEFMAGTYRSLAYTAVLVVAALILAVLVAAAASKSIALPVKLCARRLELLSEGDLKTPVPQISNKDETGQLAKSTQILVESFQAVISDISRVLGEMAGNDLTAETTADYKGDFLPICEAVQKISDSLNYTLRDINIAADQVSDGSEQVAGGAQQLSQGATEQASAVEELAATINEISSQVQSTATNALDADEQSRRAGREVGICNEKMTDMTRAIMEISESSGEIGKIIKTIEDIAFQTNILALNAAVEAARAGAAGKGFAVVADEVRNLAGKSAEAAKNTTGLIEQAISNVEHGTQIAEETAQAMLNVVECTQSMSATIDRISKAAGEQADSIAQVTLGIDQISSVVQTNSATAEQSAAASEELSGQAQTMKDLVGKFKLKELSSGGTFC